MASLSNHIQEISSLTDKIRETNFTIEEHKLSIASLESASPHYIGDNIAAKVDNELKVEAVRRMSIDASIANINVQIQQWESKDPEVDEQEIRDDLRETIEGIETLSSLLTKLSEKFDELFGSSNARQLLVNQIRGEILNRKVTYEELMSTKEDCVRLESSLMHLDDIHEDIFIKFSRYLFFNVSGNIKGSDDHKFTRFFKFQVMRLQYYIQSKGWLLIVYIVYGILVLLTLKLLSPYSSLFLRTALVTTVFISASNYLKFVNSFKVIAEIEAKLDSCSEGLEETILAKVEDERSRQLDQFEEEANKLKITLEKHEQELKDFDASLAQKRKEIQEKIYQEEEEKKKAYNEEYEKTRKTLADLKELVSSLTEEEKQLNEQLTKLQDEVLTVAGLTEHLEEKEEIFSPEMLMGFDDTTNMPQTLNISKPSFISGDKEDVDYIIETIIVQLLGRMLSTKVYIHIYDPVFAGKEYVSYLSKKFKEEGVQLLKTKEDFSTMLKEFSTSVTDFQYSLKAFKDIKDYNEFMISTDSVTRPYHLVILRDIPPNLKELTVFGEHYGFYWLSTVKPTKEDELKVFEEIFSNEISLPN